MSKTLRISEELRNFLRQFTEIIFANPFSFDAQQLQEHLGLELAIPPEPAHHYSALTPILRDRLEQLERLGIRRLADAPESDRDLLQYAFLFELYDEYAESFDKLIETQLSIGDKPADVPFAGELIFKLKRRGFDDEQTQRFLALFYQLRRAHHFISQALPGSSPCMTRLRHGLWNNIFTSDVRLYADHLWQRMEDFSTLLLGETGTGKGSAAAAIGRSGLIPFDRSAGRFAFSFSTTFIATNLARFPESLIESELFGHRKGAFTGAIDNHQGLFERCNPHGALFLDEIGDVSIPVQIKLLNVLQERHFSPVGSHKLLRFSGRLIAATNRPVERLRHSGEFRDDFYYRLCSDIIEVPPLRTRLAETPEELPGLVKLLLIRLTGVSAESILEKVLTALRDRLPEDYSWPGNVRELEQAVRRILLTGNYTPQTTQSESENWLAAVEAGELSAKTLMTHYCKMLYRKTGSYESVATKTQLDWRTVKKYIAE